MKPQSSLFDFAVEVARAQGEVYKRAHHPVVALAERDGRAAKAERDRVLTELQGRRKVLLVALNHRLEELARSRSVGGRPALVTADDAHRIVAEWPEAAGLDPRWTGAVWKLGPWVKTGAYYPSLRRACHARPIPVWRLDPGAG